MKVYEITIKAMLELSEDEFIQNLLEITKKVSLKELDKEKRRQAELEEEKQVEAWKDCLGYLKRYFKGITDVKILNTKLIFEYELIDNTRIDVLICCLDKVIIVEFKSGEDDRKSTLTGYIQQLNSYYNKLKDYNKYIWSKKVNVFKFLVFTNLKMKGKVPNEEFIKVEDEFRDVIDEITSPMNEDDMKHLTDIDNEASPDVLELFGKVLNEEYLPELLTNTKSVMDCTNLVSDIQNTNDNNTLNIVFVNGAAGTGKTAVGFNILKDLLNNKKYLKVKYTTGNGNLYNIFSHMINNKVKDNKENRYVTKEHIKRARNISNTDEFIEFYVKKDSQYKQKPIINSDVIIFDEAQRAWSKEKIAIDLSIDKYSKDIYNKNISQPYCMIHSLISTILYEKKSKTIVCLVGKGQEIYVGEEYGENSWIEAINILATKLEKYNTDVKIKIYSPINEGYEIKIKDNTKMSKEFKDYLLLTDNKRGYKVNDYLQFVEHVLNNKVDDAKRVVDKIKDKYSINISQSMYNIRNYLKSIDKNQSVGIFSSSYEGKWKNDYKTISANSDVFKNVKKEKLPQWFTAESSCLEEYVTEFDCQGLEIDIPILIWGDKLKIRSNKWRYGVKNTSKKLKKYYREFCDIHNTDFKEEDFRKFEEKIVTNIFRVLLTRGRNGIILYIQDEETFNYFKALEIKSLDE